MQLLKEEALSQAFSLNLFNLIFTILFYSNKSSLIGFYFETYFS